MILENQDRLTINIFRVGFSKKYRVQILNNKYTTTGLNI